MYFNNLIKSLREKANMNQKDLSKKSGVSQAVISKFEQGKINPRLTSFINIVKGLGYKLKLVRKK
jgi:predicted transcriptional regulator